ncbi:hypothetical protein PCASD_06366 [Puccinia coronata f. sp. avenae]|uniref:Secreted protein n=1 Tax=Puccinia coronata f. sp. avenae TaxID=200324 RepID=A0A2N5UXI4_9BASI|nr:hypothetical protein PCASD_06366 [Puccinia coronata f. sp. avenae]
MSQGFKWLKVAVTIAALPLTRRCFTGQAAEFQQSPCVATSRCSRVHGNRFCQIPTILLAMVDLSATCTVYLLAGSSYLSKQVHTCSPDALSEQVHNCSPVTPGKQVHTCSLATPGKQVHTCSPGTPGEQVHTHRELWASRYTLTGNSGRAGTHLLTGSSRRAAHQEILASCSLGALGELLIGSTR